MDYLLFTTCDAKGGRLPELIRLFDSLSVSLQQDAKLGFQHYVLLQNCTSLPDVLSHYVQEYRVFIFVSKMVSLSRARNIMIKEALRIQAFDRAVICAFPDDDAWYPENFLTEVGRFFDLRLDIDIFACRYGALPVGSVLDGENTLNGLRVSGVCGDYIRTACSITLFLRSPLAKRNGFFDERLGVGAAINGGEDLDYALRAFSLSNRQVALSSQKLVGHRDWTPLARGKYFAGSLFGIARSSGHSLCMRAQLLRKIFVGAYFFLRGEMTFSQYVFGLRVGLTGLGDSNVLVE